MVVLGLIRVEFTDWDDFAMVASAQRHRKLIPMTSAVFGHVDGVAAGFNLNIMH